MERILDSMTAPNLETIQHKANTLMRRYGGEIELRSIRFLKNEVFATLVVMKEPVGLLHSDSDIVPELDVAYARDVVRFFQVWSLK